MRKYVIIGAGNGGQSLAGDMSLRGVMPAAIYDIDVQAINAIRQKGGIQMSGPVVEGFAPIDFATTSLEEAIRTGDVFLICITSNAYRSLAKQIASYITPEQTFLLLPGYVGSSLVFAKTLKENGVDEMPLIGESISFPYATRLIEPAHAGIKARKFVLPIAAFPASRNQELLDIIKPAIFEAALGQDSLSVGFNNVNPASHIVPYLLNMDKVEAPRAEDHDFHTWGSKTVQRIKYQLDEERCSVMKAMGLEIVTYDDFHNLCYQGKHYTPLPQKESAGLPTTAKQVPNRFIDEDVPMGIVPMAEFATLVEIQVPVISLMVQLASIVRQRDLKASGISLEDMGLSGMSVERILQYVMTGL